MAEQIRKKGNELFKEQKYSEAIEKYTEFIDLNPNNFSIYNNRSLCRMKINQYDEAYEDIQKGFQIEENPEKNPKCYQRLLSYYDNKKRYIDAYNLITKMGQKVEFGQIQKYLGNIYDLFDYKETPVLEYLFSNDILQVDNVMNETEQQIEKIQQEVNIINQLDELESQHKQILEKHIQNLQEINSQELAQELKSKIRKLQILIYEQFIKSPENYQEEINSINNILQLLDLPSEQQEFINFIEMRGETYEQNDKLLLAKQDYQYIYSKKPTVKHEKFYKNIMKKLEQQKKVQQQKKTNGNMDIENDQAQEQKKVQPAISCSYKSCQNQISQYCPQCDQNLKNLRNQKQKTSHYCYGCMEFLDLIQQDNSDPVHGKCEKNPQTHYLNCSKCNKQLCQPHNKEAILKIIQEKIKQPESNADQFYKILDYALDIGKEYKLEQPVTNVEKQLILVLQIEILFIQKYYSTAEGVFKTNKKNIADQINLNYIESLMIFFIQDKRNGLLNQEQYEIILKNCNEYSKKFSHDSWAKKIKNTINEEIQKISPQTMECESRITEDEQQLNTEYQFETQDQLYLILKSLYEEDVEKSIDLLLQSNTYQSFSQIIQSESQYNLELFNQLVITVKRGISQQLDLSDQKLLKEYLIKIQSNQQKFKELIDKTDEDSREILELILKKD